MEFKLEGYKIDMKIHKIKTHTCLKNKQLHTRFKYKRKKDEESTYCKNILNSEASKFSTATGSWFVKLFVCPTVWKQKSGTLAKRTALCALNKVQPIEKVTSVWTSSLRSL